MKICFVTDTGTDLPPSLIGRKDIIQAPLHFIFGEDIGETMSRDEFSSKLKTTWPKTSGPSAGEFIEAFRKAEKAGYDHIVCLPISSGLSGSFKAALIAAEMFGDSNVLVRVIDTKTISLGIGFLISKLLRMLEDPRTSFEELCQTASDFHMHSRLLVLLDTLENLRRGGRASYLQSQLASVLKIKPIITVGFEGTLGVLEKVRTPQAAISRVIEIVCKTKTVKRIGIMFTDDLEAAKSLRDRIVEALLKLGKRLNLNDVVVCQVCLPVFVHAGKKAVGVCIET